VFAFVPMFLALSATLIDPQLVGEHLADGRSAQNILPLFVLGHTPLAVQVLFFGALLSAILSCSSATLAGTVGDRRRERPAQPFFPNISDRQFLRMLRIVVFLFALAVLAFSLFSNRSIYAMVEGPTRSRSSPRSCRWRSVCTGAAQPRRVPRCAMAAGISTWLGGEAFAPEALLPAVRRTPGSNRRHADRIARATALRARHRAASGCGLRTGHAPGAWPGASPGAWPGASTGDPHPRGSALSRRRSDVAGPRGKPARVEVDDLFDAQHRAKRIACEHLDIAAPAPEPS
jgi:hypothetical protein